jgi:arylsulfatase A-like enzyme
LIPALGEIRDADDNFLELRFMQKRTCGVLILCLAGFLVHPACRKSRESGVPVLRLMDRLSTADIRRSPLPGMEKADFDRCVPVNSFPLKELGTGDNPFGIKKKLSLGVLEIDILFAPPKSEYSQKINLPEGATLKFGMGVVRDSRFESLTSPSQPAASGVNFLIRLESRGGKKTVFQKFVKLPPQRTERTLEFSMRKLRLPDIKGELRLSLVTQADGKAFSFWHNPVIYVSGPKPRGVILISVDTLRADHLQTYGYRRPTSPNLDSLAADGVVFSRTYASSPWTLPSHVSLLTSLFNINHGVHRPTDRMDDSLVTLTEVLRQNGFSTSAITGGTLVSYLYGFSRGFDTYKEGDGAMDYNNSAELVARSAAEWLENNKDNDFFLFLHTYQVHTPYDAPSPYGAMFLDPDAVWKRAHTTELFAGKKSIFKELPDAERRNMIGLYDAEIRYTDEALLKPLVEKLKALGLYDDTMIIFTSDHGEEFFEHGSWDHGIQLYDESIRVPLVIKFPGSRFQGKRVESVVRGVDVMPTVLEEMEIEAGRLKLDGQSLLSLLRGKGKDRRFLADTLLLGLGESSAQGLKDDPLRIAANDGRTKIILNRELDPKEKAYFIPPAPDRPTAELYDLDADPGEKTELSTRKAEVANRLTRELRNRYAAGRKTRPSKANLSKEMEERLRALGYIR